MIRYRLLVWLLAPVFVGYTLWTALRYRDLRYLFERLGFARRADRAGRIWLHAASVGEVNAAAALVRRLAARADGRIVMTTVTPTGAAIARERLGDCVLHRYLPIDWPFAVRSFVRRLQPACLLVMETELWPHLFHACSRASVPIILVNGRLSMRSLHENRWWRQVQRKTLSCVRAVLARTAADTETFLSLGMEAGRVRTIGNLKFAVSGTPPRPISLGRPYVLAASTREEEERPILNQWHASRHNGRLLVMAPRHPQRLNEILAALAPSGARIAVRSRNEPVTQDTEVYLADTLGELGGFIAGAELVIMAGSFEPFGGHNILEPAQLGKAVIFGPRMENFLEAAALLSTNEAGIQLPSIDRLAETLSDLLTHPEKADVLGKNAARLMAERAGVIDDYVEALSELCPALA